MTDSPEPEAFDLAVVLASAISGDRPKNEVLNLLAQLAAEAVAADVGTVGRLLGNSVEVIGTWARESTLKSAPPVGTRLPISGMSPPATAVRTGEPVIWSHGFSLDATARAEVGGLVDSGSGVAVPIRADRRVWGHLGVISAAGDGLDERAAASTSALAETVAPIVVGLEARESALDADRFFRLSGDFFAILSPRGTVLRANLALEHALDTSTDDDLVGSAWADWVHEDDRESAARWLGRVSDGADARLLDARIARTERTVRWTAYLDPRDSDIYLIGRDVTREVATTRELDEMRRLQGAILTSVGDGVYGVDLDGRATFVNPAAARSLGYTPDELLGKRTHDLLHHSRPDGSAYPFTSCPMRAAVLGQRASQADDEVFWRKDGTPIPVRYVATPLRLNGEPAGAVVVFSDATDRREEEAARRDAAVRESLQRQNKELEDLARRLEESNRDLEQFAYVASHDLQAPLRAIVSHLALISDEVLDTLDEETREDMRFVSEGAARMQNMIDSLLEYSRASRHENLREPVDLGIVTDDALRLLSSDVAAAGATITRDEDLPTALGDEQQLVRVVQNLVANALRYGPEGAVVVSITGETVGDSCRLSVSDNGPGVPEKYRSRVFEMFKRLHTTDRGGGIGMGLAICDRIISRHGGSIWVEDAPNGGSRFTIELQTQVSP